MLLHYHNARLFLHFLPLQQLNRPLDAQSSLYTCISSAIEILNIANERLEEAVLRFSGDYPYFMVSPFSMKTKMRLRMLLYFWQSVIRLLPWDSSNLKYGISFIELPIC